MRGVDILIYVESPTTPGTFVAVGGQRGAKFSEKSETIDITSKMSNGYKENDYGLGEFSFDCDGIYLLGNTQLLQLRDAMRNKTLVKVRWTETGNSTIDEGFCLVTSRELEAPYDAEVTYKMELTGTGKPTLVMAP